MTGTRTKLKKTGFLKDRLDLKAFSVNSYENRAA